MSPEEITIDKEVIYYQTKTAAGFLENPIITKVVSEVWQTNSQAFCKVEACKHYVNVDRLRPVAPQSQQIKLLQSQINRIKAHIEQVETNDMFTTSDRKILIPHYREILNKFSEKKKHLEKAEEKALMELTVKHFAHVNDKK